MAHEQYSSPESADFVYLNFIHSKEDLNRGQKISFLLDQGRLQLHIVKEYFGLKTLEIQLGMLRDLI